MQLPQHLFSSLHGALREFLGVFEFVGAREYHGQLVHRTEGFGMVGSEEFLSSLQCALTVSTGLLHQASNGSGRGSILQAAAPAYFSQGVEQQRALVGSGKGVGMVGTEGRFAAFESTFQGGGGFGQVISRCTVFHRSLGEPRESVSNELACAACHQRICSCESRTHAFPLGTRRQQCRQALQLDPFGFFELFAAGAGCWPLYGVYAGLVEGTFVTFPVERREDHLAVASMCRQR